jgi:prephenate dehydrogenase
MAGSEQTGMAHARGDLFDTAACIVTPLEDTPAQQAGRIAAFWEALGMQVTHVSPERHDEIVAHISHLPHLLASALCSFLAGKAPAWKSLAGKGLLDTTRIASGDPELWQQILESNRDEVVRAINGLEEEIHQIKSALINQNTASLKQRLERGKNFRDNF